MHYGSDSSIIWSVDFTCLKNEKIHLSNQCINTRVLIGLKRKWEVYINVMHFIDLSFKAKFTGPYEIGLHS